MSLSSLANFCAHLKNCTNVNIGLTSVPLSRLHLQVALNLYKEGFLSSIQRGSTVGPDEKPVDPGRKVNLSTTEVKALASGFPVRFIKPLQPAECIFLRTEDNEVVEIQEAAKRDLQGLALCRVK
ncbi:uncharacterized protein CXQ87_001911 [Candidozyma duobushaemuli]|uniref:Ribosomal protein S8 n=1 Tax=Candidozyma duobushaemuli TaxID=1231522 RepID=A0A2V1A973_9ASCO|nr:uncharacterized protein CXQ87_001911 [[Candida] duobushaemulonis]PVH13793.1 hypothetical protein CXQ87_001911 [[Candida] duobushaemulonis]